MTYPVVKLTKDVNIPEGHRLSTILFRQAEGKQKRENLAVAVPTLAPVTHQNITDELLTAVNALIIDWQDDLIRTLIVDGGATELDEARIDFAATIKSALAASTSRRLNGEAIGAWYDSNLAQPLAAAVIAKAQERKEAISDEKVAGILAGYRSAFMKLAAVKPAISKANAQQLLAALAKGTTDAMAKELARKLDLIINPTEITLEAI